MKSPFPGMDPYIEACGLWEDFHDDLIQEIKRALAAVVPERYLVRTGERTYLIISGPEGETHHGTLPDVGVLSPSTTAGPLSGQNAAVAEADTDVSPISMRAFVEEQYRETFVDIYQADATQMLVTSLEVLSPTNKRKGSPGWDLYLRKRQALLVGAANLVEMDLLRGGTRLPMLDEWPNSPYTILVARKRFAPTCRVWPAHYLRPLPAIPVPLLEPDPDVTLNLQPMIEAIYERSRYSRSIDYGKKLTPPLSQEGEDLLARHLQIRQD